ncbi:6-phosphogluconolactonase [Mesorhizobium soli]|jgi:6-phosphogluconolactonase|uniref:6-phosphogluconolactonase n=1 Tax=Pseudaminobacter soli (ex Li et al. 2025) TaxID=1295366 RepID=UPI00247433B2|nr:6-phosphogluconolactonase [Mesorhizobium soli]MDH6230329.1 6-phosphogluconolactonase [Mesorhizobium soli]
MDAPARNWHDFASSEALALGFAETVAKVLSEAISARGKATLAVSGGTTPGPFFRTLSRAKIDWAKVIVTLVDERFVPEESPRSNAGLVAANLLQNEAAAASFVGLYSPAGDVESAARHANGVVDALLPLDAVILGMGGDGHTASFFPDADNLAALLDPHAKANVLPVHAPSGIEPRLTLTLPRIASAGFIALHIEGAGKRQVLEAALDGEPHLPVRTVFDHARVPVQIFWAP